MVRGAIVFKRQREAAFLDSAAEDPSSAARPIGPP
jgi:hypothetical protein